MKISRPASAAAALGTTLLLGACFAGHTATPAPCPGHTSASDGEPVTVAQGPRTR